jgi:hypothetical protein
MLIIILVSVIIAAAIIGNIYSIKQDKKAKEAKQPLSIDSNESIIDKVEAKIEEAKNIVEETVKAEVEILKGSVKTPIKKKPAAKKKPSTKK